jgi:hypothetical protein
MRQVKLLGLALLALFALSAVASSVAAANPTILPTPTAGEPLKFTSKTKAGSVMLLESTSGKKLTCEKGIAEGEFTSADHGKATAIAEGCKEEATKAKCTSGATAGVVEGEGLIELVDVLPAGVLQLGVWGESFARGGEATKKDLTAC